MSGSIKNTNLRFNMEKETQHRAWEYLRSMDKRIFKSYNQVIALALVDYFERYYRTQDDPYLETREREERFVTQIVSAVQTAMEKSLPVFLAGCMAGIGQRQGQNVMLQAHPAEVADAGVDWAFLGE